MTPSTTKKYIEPPVEPAQSEGAINLDHGRVIVVRLLEARERVLVRRTVNTHADTAEVVIARRDNSGFLLEARRSDGSVNEQCFGLIYWGVTP